MGKQVSYDAPVFNSRGHLVKCCDKASQVITAVPSIRVEAEPEPRYGYVLESAGCDCPSRWIDHDWRRGHAEFVRASPTATLQLTERPNENQGRATRARGGEMPQETLVSGQNTRRARQAVFVAAHRAVEVGQHHKRLQLDFEHGQWWVTCLKCGQQWAVEDAAGPGTCDGFDFETATPSDESCYSD